jgi:hypothetical protein
MNGKIRKHKPQNMLINGQQFDNFIYEAMFQQIPFREYLRSTLIL